MPPRLTTIVRNLASGGRYHFTTESVGRVLGTTVPATRAALRRLKAKGEIADPFRGFYVIVPPEYRRLGCLPPEQFVPQLMEHLGETYYVALLSAAELYGAAHQRPQAFQVMVKTNRRPLECGDVRVQFVARKDMELTPFIERKTPRGMIRVASPEATMLELVGYAEQSGGLSNVASIVDELVESIDVERLVVQGVRSPVAWVQRLGYLLDLTHHRDVADSLVPIVHERANVIAPLVRANSRSGAPRDARWNLALNAVVELES